VRSEADVEPAIQCKNEEMTSYHFNHPAVKSNIALAQTGDIPTADHIGTNDVRSPWQHAAVHPDPTLTPALAAAATAAAAAEAPKLPTAAVTAGKLEAPGTSAVAPAMPGRPVAPPGTPIPPAGKPFSMPGRPTRPPSAAPAANDAESSADTRPCLSS
jgi:hypothetical protein